MSPLLPRRRRSLLVVASVFAIVLALLGVYQFGVKRLPPTDPAALDELDTRMFVALQTQYDAFARTPEALWDADYRYDREPLLLVRKDADGALAWPYVYLVNMSSLIDTSRFARMEFAEDSTLSDVRVATDVDLQILTAWTPGTFDTLEYAGRGVLAFTYSPAQFDDDSDPLLQFATFSMHEAFHVNVQPTWRQDIDGGARVWDPPTGAQLRALFGQEFAALDAVTTATDDAQRRDIAARIVEERRAQVESVPALSARAALETIEGSARYLERRYSDVSGGRIGVLTNKRGETSSFGAVLDWATSADGDPGIFEHTIWYETGAQLAFLLDHLAPDWKARVADGRTTMFDVLVDAVDAHG
ncbi:hypothetical protein M3672_00540 [Microbacterium enclense]|uniref:hypothetical protein n=1 Tax=Microbacterium enclense TaxID=993073 RepID=UPI00203C5898|nr:hypothetical protein [Microbacterium enclense]MCM3612924.1 hypothetical protein [Microbacterium enclense]